MSFRTDLLATVDAARAISGPAGLDIRTNQLTIRTITWSGKYARDGVIDSTQDTVLPAYYPIRFIRGEEIEASGGQYTLNDVLVNHITPSNGLGVGFTPEQLNPPKATDNVETIYVITGPMGGNYALVDCRTHRPFTYQLVLRRMLE